MNIDLVFTYVNGFDLSYTLKKNSYMEEEHKVHNPAIRHEGIDEIVWAVKSALHFMPWLRTIYIVVDNQALPGDLPTLSPKLRVIHHTDIIPSQYLPTYNSDVIESWLHAIPDISEVFLYNNDDIVHLAPISLDEFVSAEDERLKVKSKLNMTVLRAKTTEYSKRICLTVDLLRERHPYIQCINNHHTKILRKSTLKHLESEYAEWLETMRLQRFRGDNYIQYLMLAQSVDHFLNNNEISYDFRDVVEVHVSCTKYQPNFFERYKNRVLKFACFNGMDSSYKEAFDEFMRLYI